MIKSLSSSSWFGRLGGWPGATLIILLVHLPANAQKFTIALELRGQQVEGTPLVWNDSDVALLQRDGSLLNFAPAQARGFRKTADGFQSYSQGEIRAQLAREFGPKFDVSGTGHYLVVHPAGQRDQWAGRFEQLYRSFLHYFTARGFRPREPQFPFIAVIFPNQTSFLSYAQRTEERLQQGTLGYYSPTSNRILLYDITQGRAVGADWQVNAETIIHEAAHQSAFNTAIHNRFAHPPRWVIEGLGTMFEARGVWNSRQYPAQADRINRGRLADFQQYAAARRTKGSLARTVSSDRFFQSLQPADAYAEAWALTFFLAETQPAKYIDFLRKTAARSSFTTYRSPERLRDFSDTFGADLSMLDAQFVRFMSRLR